jgi:hypothetical protein
MIVSQACQKRVIALLPPLLMIVASTLCCARKYLQHGCPMSMCVFHTPANGQPVAITWEHLQLPSADAMKGACVGERGARSHGEAHPRPIRVVEVQVYPQTLFG